MRLVSSNSDAAISDANAEEEVKRALRTLGANILRCAAGGGKPGMIDAQCAAYLAARHKLSEGKRGMAVNAAAALSASIALTDHREWVEDGEHANSDIARHAMRIWAGYLEDNLTQVSRSETALHDAILEDGYERVHPKPY